MGITVSYGGAGTEAIIQYLEGVTERTVAQAAKIVSEAIDQGVERIRDFIDESVTRTGEARVAAGGAHAGRRETDDMYDAVQSVLEVDGNRIIGRVGWTEGMDAKIAAQEYGTGKIAAMNSLGQVSAELFDTVAAQVEDLN